MDEPKAGRAALTYATVGWHVLPLESIANDVCTCNKSTCPSPGKHPVNSLAPNGSKNATTHEDTIKMWWDRRPGANVGILTGPESGLLVVDVDIRNDGDKTLARLLDEHGPFPETPQCRTGGGGSHYYFKHPDGRYRSGKLEGIDIKVSGYVAAPPSRHKSGAAYTWVKGAEPAIEFGGIPLAEPPAWLVAMLDPVLDAPAEDVEDATADEDGCYHEGSRDVRLTQLAGYLISKQLAPDAVLAALIVENRLRFKPPFPDDHIRWKTEGYLQRWHPKPEFATPSLNKAPTIVAASWDRIVDPEVGRIEYLVDNFIPRHELVLLASHAKTGKTMAMYQMILDAALGRPAFGTFKIPKPVRIALFQMEMTLEEDMRRFRRLALGSDTSPEDVLHLIKQGYLIPYSRPKLSVANSNEVRAWHRAIRENDAEFVYVDSLAALCAPLDINDGSIVQGIFRDALLPLTTEGRTVLINHHNRKLMQAVNGKPTHDDPKQSILGSQRIIAGVGRAYSLSRCAPDDKDPKGTFRTQIVDAGSWGPEEEDGAVMLVTEDVGDLEQCTDGKLRRPGTRVTHLSVQAQLARGGVTTEQRIGIAVATLVRMRPGITREELFQWLPNTVEEQDKRRSPRSMERGLSYALGKGWARNVSKIGHPATYEPGAANPEEGL